MHFVDKMGYSSLADTEHMDWLMFALYCGQKNWETEEERGQITNRIQRLRRQNIKITDERRSLSYWKNPNESVLTLQIKN
jgi:hypothetical protein